MANRPVRRRRRPRLTGHVSRIWGLRLGQPCLSSATVLVPRGPQPPINPLWRGPEAAPTHRPEPTIAAASGAIPWTDVLEEDRTECGRQPNRQPGMQVACSEVLTTEAHSSALLVAWREGKAKGTIRRGRSRTNVRPRVAGYTKGYLYAVDERLQTADSLRIVARVHTRAEQVRPRHGSVRARPSD